MQYFYASFMRGLEIQTDNASVERGGRKQKNKQKKKTHALLQTALLNVYFAICCVLVLLEVSFHFHQNRKAVLF